MPRVFLLSRPSDQDIREFISQQSQKNYSYPEVGASKLSVPPGYTMDHHQVRLGQGEDVFARAKRALQEWSMFQQPWIRLYWPQSPIEAGVTVAVVAHCVGLWVMNASRIIYVIDEVKPSHTRYGFAYGTLEGHVERGEERFMIELRQDGSVWYDIFSFSRPNHLLALIGYPYTRNLQKRFAIRSLRAMRQAVDRRDQTLT